jgi:hypothetical protein
VVGHQDPRANNAPLVFLLAVSQAGCLVLAAHLNFMRTYTLHALHIASTGAE